MILKSNRGWNFASKTQRTIGTSFVLVFSLNVFFLGDAHDESLIANVALERFVVKIFAV